MKTTINAVVDAYFAYVVDNVLDVNRPMPVKLAYKISKNIAEIKQAYKKLLETRINPIRHKYNWDETVGDGGLVEPESSAYDQEYQNLLTEETDINIILISPEELTFEVTLDEMRVLSIMIDLGELDE